MSSGHYEAPSWAGKPPPGFHLDVFKDGKLFQKLMIDEKKCYHFGRNPNLNDVCIDHQSCSRVHAALVYHKLLERCFLVDLGSSHGTFIGNLRLESHKPTQLPINSSFHFGASTRYYILRERPSNNTGIRDGENNSETNDIGPLLLPESEMELDNLTEFNTAHNKRVSMMGIREEEPLRHKAPTVIRFKEEDEIINPEDIDPTVGKFRNLIQTTVIPTKRVKLDSSFIAEPSGTKRLKESRPRQNSVNSFRSPLHPTISTSLSFKLGINLPNPAPEVNLETPKNESETNESLQESPNLPKKKKYAKEAWPGRRPSLL